MACDMWQLTNHANSKLTFTLGQNDTILPPRHFSVSLYICPIVPTLVPLLNPGCPSPFHSTRPVTSHSHDILLTVRPLSPSSCLKRHVAIMALYPLPLHEQCLPQLQCYQRGPVILRIFFVDVVTGYSKINISTGCIQKGGRWYAWVGKLSVPWRFGLNLFGMCVAAITKCKHSQYGWPPNIMKNVAILHWCHWWQCDNCCSLLLALLAL